MSQNQSWQRVIQSTKKGELDRTRGFAQIVDGQLFYSPNSNRIITIPLPITNPQEYFSYVSHHIDQIRQPQWWCRDLAYLAFVALAPDYLGPLQGLASISTPPCFLDGKLRFDPCIQTSWLDLESRILEATTALINHCQVPGLSPPKPSSLGLSHHFKTHLEYQAAAHKIKDWFSIWMAHLSYALAIAQSSSEQQSFPSGSHQPLSTEMAWAKEVVSFRQQDVRAGVLLNILSPSESQCSVDWLCHFHIPVWYPWGPTEVRAAASNPNIARLQPLPHQLVGFNDFLTIEPSRKAWGNLTSSWNGNSFEATSQGFSRYNPSSAKSLSSDYSHTEGSSWSSATWSNSLSWPSSHGHGTSSRNSSSQGDRLSWRNDLSWPSSHSQGTSWSNDLSWPSSRGQETSSRNPSSQVDRPSWSDDWPSSQGQGTSWSSTALQGGNWDSKRPHVDDKDDGVPVAKRRREDHREDHRENQTLSPQQFLKKRQELHQKMKANESPQEKQTRESRTKNPPKRKKVKVFEWEESPEGSWKRTMLTQAMFEDVFSDFGKHQKIYDPFFNEWNLCHEFGPMDEEQIAEEVDDRAEYLNISPELYIARHVSASIDAMMKATKPSTLVSSIHHSSPASPIPPVEQTPTFLEPTCNGRPASPIPCDEPRVQSLPKSKDADCSTASDSHSEVFDVTSGIALLPSAKSADERENGPPVHADALALSRHIPSPAHSVAPDQPSFSPHPISPCQNRPNLLLLGPEMPYPDFPDEPMGPSIQAPMPTDSDLDHEMITPNDFPDEPMGPWIQVSTPTDPDVDREVITDNPNAESPHVEAYASQVSSMAHDVGLTNIDVDIDVDDAQPPMEEILNPKSSSNDVVMDDVGIPSISVIDDSSTFPRLSAILDTSLPTAPYTTTSHSPLPRNRHTHAHLLYQIYGFVRPLDVGPTPASRMDLASQHRLKHAAGLDDEDTDFLSSQYAQTALTFLDLFNNSRPQADTWDLAEENRLFLGRAKRLQSLVKVQEDCFVFDYGDQATVAWFLAVDNAVDAVRVLRMDAHLTDREVAFQLLQSGISLRLLAAPKLNISLAHPPLSSHLVLLPEDYEFTVDDYNTYIARRDTFLRTPRGRAAFLRGGIVWRLSYNVLRFDEILSGPCDHDLTVDEHELICGIYRCRTKFPNQTSTKSWFPLETCWKGKSACTHWTEKNEHLYLHRLEQILKEGAQPLTAKDWKQKLKINSHIVRTKARNLKLSSDFLKQMK
ncbi:hypothetical protein BDZ97DRAFT_1921365 [Flammula alnicola]|nr:hypothetical protein BDZ97DRAFT_1921365 [Flammula alnicola]